MADVKLSNIANVTGTYDSVPTTLTSEAVITEMITCLTIVKSADHEIDVVFVAPSLGEPE